MKILKVKYLLSIIFTAIVISLVGKARDPHLGESLYETPPCSDFTSEEMVGFYPISLKYEVDKMRSSFGEYEFDE